MEEALRLREAGAAAEIVAVGMGPAGTQDALRTVLGMGADRAIHVVTDTPLDPLTVGAMLATLAKEEGADLVFAGGQQASWDSQALGAITAETLGWPQVTWVNALKLTDSTLSGKHDSDDGSEIFEVPLPAVITTQQGLNEPRYPTLPNIIKSRKKEIRPETPERFGLTPTVRVVSASLQPRARLNKILDGKDAPLAAQELVKFLRTEAKVIA